MENPSEDQLNQWHKDPNNWICGIFYFNKEDKRIFPNKRIPWMGWTINFASPKSIIAFLIMMSLFVFVVYTIQSKN